MLITEQNELSKGRLKKYAASSSNGRHTLVITVEYVDAGDMGWDVRALDEILAKDRARDADLKASSRRPKALPRQLALPAPHHSRGER